MPHIISELQRERLLGGLGLELVEHLLVFGIVQGGLIRRLGYDKGIAAGIEGSGLIASRNSGGIGLRSVRESDHRWTTQHLCEHNGDHDLEQPSPRVSA